MKIKVDVESCVGHARCAAMAPDVFVLDDDGFNVTPEKEIAPELEEQARRGADACPEMAITIVED